MNMSETAEIVALVAAIVALAMTLGGLIWHAATLAQSVKELQHWREKHEPTAVELVELKALLSGVVSQITDVKADIQRLYNRSSTGGRT